MGAIVWGEIRSRCTKEVAWPQQLQLSTQGIYKFHSRTRTCKLVLCMRHSLEKSCVIAQWVSMLTKKAGRAASASRSA